MTKVEYFKKMYDGEVRKELLDMLEEMDKSEIEAGQAGRAKLQEILDESEKKNITSTKVIVKS